jgi:hypothetical protein
VSDADKELLRKATELESAARSFVATLKAQEEHGGLASITLMMGTSFRRIEASFEAVRRHWYDH